MMLAQILWVELTDEYLEGLLGQITAPSTMKQFYYNIQHVAKFLP